MAAKTGDGVLSPAVISVKLPCGMKLFVPLTKFAVIKLPLARPKTCMQQASLHDCGGWNVQAGLQVLVCKGTTCWQDVRKERRE